MDFIKEFHSYNYYNEKKNQILTENNENFVSSITDTKLIYNSISNWFSNISKKIFQILTLIFFISILILLIYYFRMNLKFIFLSLLEKVINYFRLRKNRESNKRFCCLFNSKKEKKHELIEMHDLGVKTSNKLDSDLNLPHTKSCQTVSPIANEINKKNYKLKRVDDLSKIEKLVSGGEEYSDLNSEHHYLNDTIATPIKKVAVSKDTHKGSWRISM
jgi:hypothetical protein